MTSPVERPRTRVVAAIAASATALALGCQLLVGAEVPEFACDSPDPRACPTGSLCDVTIGKCVPADLLARPDGDVDAKVDPPDGDGDDRDAGSDGPTVPPEAGPKALGEACGLDKDCASRLCGRETALTTDITEGAKQSYFCTKPCCTSEQCPSDMVCFNPGTGGNYCVPGARVRRPTLGTAPGGGDCDGGATCRSGSCFSGKCSDTCCADAQCQDGTYCRLNQLPSPFDGGTPSETFVCSPTSFSSGPQLDGELCSGVTKCSRGVLTCVDGECSPPCCGMSTCPGTDQCLPAVFPDTQKVGKLCFDRSGSTKDVGDACVAMKDCRSGLCDPDTKRCTDTCCTDDDCVKLLGAGGLCRPVFQNPPFLRCIKP